MSNYILSVLQIKVNIFLTDTHNDVWGYCCMQFPNIRNLREDRDLRQRQLAEVLHVSQNTYSQYETGVIELTAEKLVLLADFYNVSVDYLLGRTEIMEPYKK